MTGRVAVAERRFEVRAPSRTTVVVVGAGVIGRLEVLLQETLPGAARRLTVVDAGVSKKEVHGRWAGEWGLEPGPSIVVPAGEAAKTREVHARIEDAILDAGLSRDDVVIAVGGGAVLDVAGFAAATARRGVPWVAVPTSVVGQADAALGGKTAVNHARGKNLLGVFHPPSLVIADVTTLRTLPLRDRVAGLAEVYKAGVVGDPDLLSHLEERGARDDDAWWVEAAARALAVKGRLVEKDERDVADRRRLNYGHTVGHALETLLGSEALRHGEAVAMGMGVAAEVAHGRGRVGAAFIEAQDAALMRLGLPVRVPVQVEVGRLLEIVGEDKKRRSGPEHVMVLPKDGSAPDVCEDVATAEIEAAIIARKDRRERRAGGA